jgi:sulfur carrier protein ThiS
MDDEPLVRDYLGRLESAAWPLAAARRAELVGEVREHIDAALTEAGRTDEVTVRNILERLGPPEEIVAAESDGDATPQSRTSSSSSWGAIEIIAVLLLTLGGVFIPFVGPIIGLVFVWASTKWTLREKLIASAIVIALLLLPILAIPGLGIPQPGCVCG